MIPLGKTENKTGLTFPSFFQLLVCPTTSQVPFTLPAGPGKGAGGMKLSAPDGPALGDPASASVISPFRLSALVTLATSCHSGNKANSFLPLSHCINYFSFCKALSLISPIVRFVSSFGAQLRDHVHREIFFNHIL